MPIYKLTHALIFPPPDHAEPDGLLAIGGDLSCERLHLAYRTGIFPWYAEGDPICWWSPHPRFVLFPHHLHISQRLSRVIRSRRYEIRVDTAFDAVISECARTPRPGQHGTWITPEMQDAYIQLHRKGAAHSVESWCDGQLAGGLYGVSLGGTFFGESMFAHRADASKVAFVRLVEQLAAWDFDLVDCQVSTAHLVRFGARGIPRAEFLERLHASVQRVECWGTTDHPAFSSSRMSSASP